MSVVEDHAMPRGSRAPTDAASGDASAVFMVPEVGLEPTLAEANTALNRARLPIPPLRQRVKRASYQQAPAPIKDRFRG